MTDGPLFIVDNGASGRNGLDYLREWSELAKGIDIATGFFEIGSLLDLDGCWQKFDKIRILMGDEISHRTKKALLLAVKQRAEERLDESIEDDKERDPFLTGVDAIVAALVSGQIEVRVYNKDKFHAKAYITHGRFEVIGSQALVGSSNFTRPGLTQNVELNIKIESSSEVAQLQGWYEQHWDAAVDVSPDVVKVIQRHAQDFSPFDVYAQALRSMFGELEPTASDWDQHHSKMFPKLDRYQQEAYWAMVNIARQHGGALLCDGVGLGKTYVGLTLLERLVLYENKRVVLFAPKSVKDSVWVPELKRHLPHIGGVDGSADFSNLSVFSHTDLTRALEFPERFERITELADAVVIDEAHHFRNTGKRGDPADPFTRSRYYKLYDLIGGGRHKSVFMLTATPINNSLNDFKHLVELFSRGDDAYFSRTLGVTSLAGRLNSITKTLKKQLGAEVTEAEASEEAAELLSGDALFQGLVVQRSRAYARASQIQQTGDAAAFPTREDPKVAEYSIKKSYGKLLDLVDSAFQKDKPLFALPMYYPLAYYTGPDTSIDPLEWNRQAQVVGLIRTNFLKRFESSVYAFELSCDRLLRKLLAFVDVNSETAAERKRYERWLDQHQEMLTQARVRQLTLWGDDAEPEEENEDIVPPELLEKATRLPRDEYDVPEILAETYLDLDQIATLLDESRSFEPSHDDKLKKLVRLLKGKDVAGRKVLIFTEFADTARYLRRELDKAGIQAVAELDSGSKTNRADAIRRFSPYYNGLTSSALAASGEKETQVLIATDVLSEGLNLQDATRLINYDIHWNPVRLMQRIGRVDRRLNPDVEAQLVADHPSLAPDRGKVSFWNFLPPDDLDTLLRLYGKVSHKTLLISKTLGIEGKKLLKPEDDYAALKEFNAAYEGQTTVQEQLHLEYQKLLDEHPELEERLAGLPRGIFSGRELTRAGSAGVFFCYRLPALDTESNEFTRPSTMDKYRRDLRSHVLPHVGHVLLVRLDATKLNRLWATLADSGRKARSPDGQPSGLASKSIENVAMTVHRMLKDAVRWGRLARNPADAADPPRRSAQVRQVQAWDAETLRRFLGACRAADDPLYSVWAFLATTGLRRGEALGLHWADVDFAAARVRITQTLGSIKWKLVAGQPKTSAGRRPIALDPHTVSVLREHRRRMLEQRLLVGAGFVDQDYVFCEPDGRPLHPERVYQAFKRRVRKHEVPYLSPHGLRHTWATIALANGVHPRVVQERLGHAHISVTLQTYSHVQPTMHDDAAALVANLVMPEG